MVAMFARVLALVLFLAVCSTAVDAMYNAKGDVVQVTDKTFNAEVMKHPGVVIVEFYAPWCGHCKSLVPEYEKAAGILAGVVKVVAVDATQGGESLASKYQVQGFPTLKIFGADKKKPIEYQGQRTTDGIVSECMRQANQLVKDRKKGPTKPSSGNGKGSGSSGGGGSKPAGGSDKAKGKGGGSAVVELTELNFNALVLESNDHWLVEFYAPWCGHCKNLAPEWEQGSVSIDRSLPVSFRSHTHTPGPHHLITHHHPSSPIITHRHPSPPITTQRPSSSKAASSWAQWMPPSTAASPSNTA